ncbi:MAG: riboflavin biosynthesis protein RibF [Ruminococcus sp.]
MKRRAVAVGLFDGIHGGHIRILNKALSGLKDDMEPAVFTFVTESLKTKHGKPFEYIYPESVKEEALHRLGFEYIEAAAFDEVRNTDGEAFAGNILAGKMNAALVVCGENFRFGRNASCGAEDLRSFGQKFGFEVDIAELDRNGGSIPISSECIRQCLKEGRLDGLSDFGFDYTITAVVAEGNRIGRTLNFPTINQHFREGQLVPKYGVYRSVTRLDGIVYNSVTDIGVKPTVENSIKPLAETHILDYSGNLYGKTIAVTLLEFIREEKKFSSAEELRKQIADDIEYARKRID